MLGDDAYEPDFVVETATGKFPASPRQRTECEVARDSVAVLDSPLRHGVAGHLIEKGSVMFSKREILLRAAGLIGAVKDGKEAGALPLPRPLPK